jgi:hypothetical protein
VQAVEHVSARRLICSHVFCLLVRAHVRACVCVGGVFV